MPSLSNAAHDEEDTANAQDDNTAANRASPSVPIPSLETIEAEYMDIARFKIFQLAGNPITTILLLFLSMQLILFQTHSKGYDTVFDLQIFFLG